MTQKDKELLLRDLCTRLPYEVKVESVFINPDTKEHKSCGIEVFDATCLLMIKDGLGEFKPYLFPMSSMTEEQNLEFLRTCRGGNISFPTLISFDWLNKNHFDYRGLIPKNLAKDATGLNIY